MKLSTLAVVVWAAPSAAAEANNSNVISFDKSETSPPCEDFNTGVYHGADVAEYIWDEMGGSCSNIWGYEDAVDDYLDVHYPTDTSNWKTNSCNEGVEAGADQVVDKYEKQCLEESPDECYDLGHAAAQQIAYSYCPFDVTGEADAQSTPNYKESCRDVAEGICEGAVYGYVKQNGCSISTSQLDDLQDMCEPVIDAMTGGDEQQNVLSNTSGAEHVEEVSTKTAEFAKAASSVEDMANCFRKCEAKFSEGTSQMETCRSNCRAGNNRTGRDYKNSRSSGSYSDGVTKGKQEAEKIWRNNGSTCSYVWYFEDDVEDMLDRKYWQDTTYNEGVEDGAEMVVDKYERQCLNSSPDECDDLGQAAAQIIAYDFCPFSATEDEAEAYGAPNYKASCRSVAEGICEGAIYGYVRSNGCSIKTSQLSDLQDECEDQIYYMTSGSASKSNLRKN